MDDCIFCQEVHEKHPYIFHVSNDGLWAARWDPFPLLPGHVEVIPLRHAETMRELTDRELASLMPFVALIQQHIMAINLPWLYDHLLGMQDAASNPLSILLLERALARAPEGDWTPDSWTIGVNDGPAAGQTVPHFHMHVIPRLIGDVSNPRGGIRRIVPDDPYLIGN